MHHKWQSYDAWFLRHQMQQTELFAILDHFLYLYPPNNPKYQNIEKMKKPPGDIMILHMCTIHDNHIMNGSRDWSVTDRIFCHFGPFFALLPPNNLKNQNFEKMKKICGDIIILCVCTINDNQMIYGSWDSKCDRQYFFVILNHYLHFYPPDNPKIKIFKKWKRKLEILSF